MRITGLEVAVLQDRAGPVDNRERLALVMVKTDEGLTGYGEANANPQAVKALVESTNGLSGGWDNSLQEVFVGQEPSDPRALWAKAKSTTFWSCRTGVGHVALAGIEMALWDLAGKLHGRPVWQLLGERRNERLLPYITLYHGPSEFARTVEMTLETLDRAVGLGFRAAKLEPVADNTANEEEIVELVRRARDYVGPDFTLLADFGYRWTDAATATACLRRLDEFGLYALEAPFHPEHLDAYRQLKSAVSTPIATGDILTAAVDYLALLESGAVDIFQAGACRTGLSDMDELARAARGRERRFVSWGWCATALTAAANLHLSVVHDNVPLIEYAPPSIYPESVIRRELAGPDPIVRNGEFELPSAPGLGVEVDDVVLERLRVA